MPVPKRKHSKRRSRIRTFHNMKQKVVQVIRDKKTGKPKLPHRQTD